MTHNLKSFKMETLMIENGVITNNEKVLLITRPQMVGLFMGVTKPEMINLITETNVKTNKTGNPYYKQLVKKSKCNYLLCSDYTTRVNNNRVKEGKETDFVSEKSSGKFHISPCVLMDEKTQTKHYLMVERFVEVKPKVQYFFNEEPIEFDMFKQFLSPISENKSQGLDRKVIVNTPLFDSIVGFTFRGRKYSVIE